MSQTLKPLVTDFYNLQITVSGIGWERYREPPHIDRDVLVRIPVGNVIDIYFTPVPQHLMHKIL